MYFASTVELFPSVHDEGPMRNSTDRKLEIFIGATRRDLKDARVTIQQAVLEAGHIPSGMELWHSDTIPVIETIRRRLERCDVHILLIGARYGEYIDAAAEDKISFTEWEYRESLRLRKPIIVFMMDDESFAVARE
ncbi:MAG: DUF4062 domain-containing protein, partial [Planctomycetaceae bacterium]|nr:DUF4062 domain-containing protein [Planctomycetaceae bacterium]